MSFNFPKIVLICLTQLMDLFKLFLKLVFVNNLNFDDNKNNVKCTNLFKAWLRYDQFDKIWKMQVLR